MNQDMLNNLMEILANKIGQLEVQNYQLQLIVEDQQKQIEKLKGKE